MGNLKARMFNRKASSPSSKPGQIIESVALRPGQIIADIGAGGGYFSFRFAEIVGNEGLVYAVDTESGLLQFIEDSSKEKGLDNIVTVLAEENTLDLPAGNLDLVFMRNITHHISNRVEYFSKLINYLKPPGRVAIIEYKPTRSFSFRGIFGHHVAKEIIQSEMEEAGFSIDEDLNFLPEQHFTIYGKNVNK